MSIRLTGGILLGLTSVALAWTGRPHAPPLVHPNDNRRAAGQWRADTLVLDLHVREARWYPEASGGPSVVVPAFAAGALAPEIPGPLIRVSAGTQLDITVHNALPDSTVTVHGLVTHPGTADSVRLEPGQSRRLRFAAGAPGSYLYWASAGARYFTNAAGRRDSLERDQLAGAFIVDSGSAPADDRILVINLWGDPRDSTPAHPDPRRNTLTINGRAWPHTERFQLQVGDSVRWRVINATHRPHPMHLHGFYFTVERQGTGLRDSVVPGADRVLAVTTEILPRHTRFLSWLPTRPGNWLFHCHIATHVIPPNAVLDSLGHLEHPDEHMAGLVLGLQVRPSPDWADAARVDPRQVAFTVRELAAGRGRPRTIGVAIGALGAVATPRSPGPPLILTRGEPTDVLVRNDLTESTAIHWHGLELESYADGVAGWSGRDSTVAPPVAPGGTFMARLTQPRAGTFIYHTHIHDIEQLSAGLYGPLLVLEPGERFDPSRDHVFVAGLDGPQLRPPHIVLNGSDAPAPLEMARGQTHRLRLINIGAVHRLRFALYRDTALATWRPVAADGADLPPRSRVSVRSTTILPVGSTLDVEFAPSDSGVYRLTLATMRPGAPPVTVVTQRLVVR